MAGHLLGQVDLCPRLRVHDLHLQLLAVPGPEVVVQVVAVAHAQLYPVLAVHLDFKTGLVEAPKQQCPIHP